MNSIDPLNIGPQIAAIHEAIAIVGQQVHARVANLGADDQQLAALMMDGAATRLAEMRLMMVIAAGNGMAIPEELKPLEAAINDAVEAAKVQAMARFTGTPEMTLAAMDQASRSLDAARLSGMNVLGHLGAIIETAKLRQAESTRATREFAQHVVGSTAADTSSTAG
jgi:hypothetical protein